MIRVRTATTLLILGGATLALTACLSHTRTEPTLDVDASIASVTLGDDCAAERGPGIAGDCEPGFAECGGFCTQTGVRLHLEAAADGPAVPFEVLRVRMYTMDGALVDELSGRNPREFAEDGYGPWDEMIAPGADLSVSYDLDAPDWASIGGGDEWETYGMSFRIEIDVRVDGVERTLEFEPASREPEVVT